MAKKTTPGGGTTAPGRKKPAAKATAKRGSAERKPARAVSRPKTSSSSRRGPQSSDFNAADALFKLLESPLVADLLAVGATAALAAITESRHSRRTGADAKSSKVMKAAATAAAAAIGRRLSTEFEEIRKASKKSTATGER